VELHDLYSSTNIIWKIKSKIMRWVGFVACMGGTEMRIAFWWRNLKERDYLVDIAVGGRIILKYILKKEDGRAQTRLI
jgi:hypothetical protein